MLTTISMLVPLDSATGSRMNVIVRMIMAN